MADKVPTAASVPAENTAAPLDANVLNSGRGSTDIEKQSTDEKSPPASSTGASTGPPQGTEPEYAGPKELALIITALLLAIFLVALVGL